MCATGSSAEPKPIKEAQPDCRRPQRSSGKGNKRVGPSSNCIRSAQAVTDEAAAANRGDGHIPADPESSKASIKVAAAMAAKLAMAAVYQLQSLPPGQLRLLQHAVAVIAVLVAACIVRMSLPLSQSECKRLTDAFNSSAVLAGLREQATAAAAAATAAEKVGRPKQKLHIITVIGSNTPAEMIDNAPLIQGLPPFMRHSVKVLRAESRIGHGLQGFGAFGAKIIELYKFVTSPGVSPQDLVLLTDGFDVMMDAKAIRDIPSKFAAITGAGSGSSSGDKSSSSGGKSNNSSIGSDGRGSRSSGISLAVVFAAEQYCWPDKRLRSCYPSPASPYRYLNAGGLIGHAGYIYALLHPFMQHITWWQDDQRWYTTAYLALGERNGFYLDSRCEIFQTLYNVKVNGSDLVFDDVRRSWYNSVTRSYPVLLHGNGNTKHVFFSKVVPMMVASRTQGQE